MYGSIFLACALGALVASCGGSSDSGGTTGASSPSDAGSTLSDSAATSPPASVHFTGNAWADNWFALYTGDRLIAEDSVPITTERSFNAETFSFDATYPFTLAFVLKDFKENDTGLEYIGKTNQQIGDGGFVFQLRESTSQSLVIVSNEAWRCTSVQKAPLNPSCEKDSTPSATCLFSNLPEPTGWKNATFDDSSWPAASLFTAAEVGPKDGYTTIAWDASARFIWSSDLKLDNTVLCRVTVAGP